MTTFPSNAPFITNLAYVLGTSTGGRLGRLNSEDLSAYFYGGTANNQPATSYPNARLEIHPINPPAVIAAYRDKGFERLDFQFIDPDFSENVNPMYDEIAILGRSEPYLGYSGNSTRDLQITLHFAASVNAGDGGRADTAVRCTRFLQSLLYPTYANGVMYPPASCLLVIGNLFAARVVLRAAPVVYQGASLSDGDLMPSVVQVNCDFILHNVYPLGAADFIPAAGDKVNPVKPGSSIANAALPRVAAFPGLVNPDDVIAPGPVSEPIEPTLTVLPG